MLAIKEMSEQDEYVHITGIASTPKADRLGDILEPLGAHFQTPMPLLWNHSMKEPVGHVTFAKPQSDGIPFEARIPLVKEAGRLKDRVEEAIHSLKYGLVTGVSVGFKALKDGAELMKTGGMRFKQWEWLELSLVTIPANSDAVIQAIKSIDQQHMAALGDDGAPDIQGDDPTPAVKQGKRVVSIQNFRRAK